MNIRDVFVELKTEVTKNASTANIDIDKMRAMIALNEAQDEWFLEMLDKARSTDKIDVISSALVSATINRTKKSKGIHYFDISKDALGHHVERVENAVGVATKGNCAKQIKMHPIQARNKNIINNDYNSKADWTFEVAPYNLSDNHITVKADDMNIKSLDIQYYRSPREVEIEGYVKANGEKSKNVDFEFPKTAIRQIIKIAKHNIINNNKITA